MQVRDEATEYWRFRSVIFSDLSDLIRIMRRIFIDETGKFAMRSKSGMVAFVCIFSAILTLWTVPALRAQTNESVEWRPAPAPAGSPLSCFTNEAFTVCNDPKKLKPGASPMVVTYNATSNSHVAQQEEIRLPAPVKYFAYLLCFCGVATFRFWTRRLAFRMAETAIRHSSSTFWLNQARSDKSRVTRQIPDGNEETATFADDAIQSALAARAPSSTPPEPQVIAPVKTTNADTALRTMQPNAPRAFGRRGL
jgi:hypothetical protein